MRLRFPPVLPSTLLGLWVITYVITFLYASSPAVFEFAYFVLPFSAFIVPLCVAHTSCRLVGLTEVPTSMRPTSYVLSFAAAVIGVFAYGLAFSVVSRFLELPWQAGKFGDTSLSLGKSAAELFAIAATTVVLCAFALFRTAPPKSRYAQYAVASIGMVVASSAMYLLFGLSPLVQWRA